MSDPYLTDEGIQFVTDYHLATLSTMGADGRIHSTFMIVRQRAP